MDFFEHQERARRRTGRLVLLFGLAVALLVAGLYGVVRGVMIYGLGLTPYGGPSAWWDAETFWWVTLLTLAIVLLGSTYKTLQLQAGGGALAASLGGRLLARSTKDPAERRVLNVVDEMAIASGMAPPPVYVLDEEPGINAFAAGFTPEDAVIGVTRGCTELLDREELQGVIAHEFSHVLNGDMRLNVQLLGFIHGILIVGLAGRMLLRTALYPRGRFGPRRQDGRATAAFFAIGLAVMAVGYLGVLFGNLIKAAVSRQREYLADASAVQFTRLPAGLAGALKKIGGLAEGSLMLDPASMTISHMLFGQGQGSSGGLDSLFATHPPLLQRIRRIDPRFNGRFPTVRRPEPAAPSSPAVAAAGTVSPVPAPVPGGSARAPTPVRDLPDPLALIGNPTAAQLDYAQALLDRVPETVREAARDPYGARALAYALLLDERADVRGTQMGQLEREADRTVVEETRRLEPAVAGLEPGARLPLIDLAIPTLTQLSPAQYRVFKRNLDALAQADGTIALFEWMLHHVLLRHLEPAFRTVRKPVAQYYSLKRLAEPCSVLLSTLAHRARASDGRAADVFATASAYLGIDGLALLPEDRCSLPALDRALAILAQCSPRETRTILRACTACILADAEVAVEEAELLRAVADVLGCPLPPLLAGQRVPPPGEAGIRGGRPAALARG